MLCLNLVLLVFSMFLMRNGMILVSLMVVFLLLVNFVVCLLCMIDLLVCGFFMWCSMFGVW